MPRCPFCKHDNPYASHSCDHCGASLAWSSESKPFEFPDDLRSRLRTLLDQGQTIEAIKLFRSHTGAGLKQAKDAVEAIGRGEQDLIPDGNAGPLEGELLALLGQGKKIEAIKRYREATGVGLKEAKDAVEALGWRHGMDVPSQGSGCLGVLVLALMSLVGSVALAETQDQHTDISEGRRDERGVLSHAVRSEFQEGTTSIRVLLPEGKRPGERFPVIYLLPVEATDEHRYGDAIEEILRLDLHREHKAIFVAPSFTDLPWYADHPTDPRLRQEHHVIDVVLPFVEAHYPARTDPGGRLLLGFSKSGWGAYSLLLRHPDVFGKAAAWDAPLMMSEPGKYGSGPIFGSLENFRRYQLSRLLEERADELSEGSRLILLGFGNFRDDHRAAHALMERLGISHLDRDGPERDHDWHSGWVSEAVELLLEKLPPG
ncbi:ribosomal protein L7/L12 [Tautonia rosea]|uniref:ribosomal protein L7/L12 n=1 Tax=Tautonia rosea TaxID=2728037 RepID=UPI001474C98F|nr:ribosomal protein L7/L12 [Tautonia rosea]